MQEEGRRAALFFIYHAHLAMWKPRLKMGETVTVCSAQYLTTLRSLPTFFSPLDTPPPPSP